MLPDALSHLSAVLSPFLTGAALALLLAASLQDVATRLISNKIPLALTLCGLLLRWADGTAGSALVVAGGVFLPAVLAWRAGMLGGGDVKTLAAASLLFPPLRVPFFLLTVALAGGVIAGLYLLLARLLPAPSPRRSTRSLFRRILRVENWRIHRHPSLPYAAAIAVGTVFTFLH